MLTASSAESGGYEATVVASSPRRIYRRAFQSHYFRPQPLDLVGGFAHRGPGVQVNRNAAGLLTQPLHYVFRFLDHGRLAPVRLGEPLTALNGGSGPRLRSGLRPAAGLLTASKWKKWVTGH